MQKIIFFLFASITFASNAQTEHKESAHNISFVNTFQFTIGFSNLIPNKSMMGEAHSEAFPSITARLGVFSYNRFTIGLNAGFHNMGVKNMQYFGYFDNTSVITLGPYMSYYQTLTANSLFEPYISYDYAKYTSKYLDKELDFESDGLGLGIDYQHKIGNRAYVTFGLKYSFNKMRTETHPNWEKYMNNYNFMSAKIGFTFSKNRL